MTAIPLRAAVVLALTLVLGACGATGSSPGTSGTPGGKAPVKAQVVLLSNSSPHVSVIDAETRQVVRTADIPRFTSWTWNDDNNYFDGKDLWLGTLDRDAGEAAILTLNLDTLEVTSRIPLGKEKVTLYLGKPTRDGRLLVAKHGSWQVAIVDTKTRQVLKYVDVPTNAGTKGAPPFWAVCDIDTGVGPDGIERTFYPTWRGSTVVALDSRTGQPLKTAEFPEGSEPWMLSVAPDGKVWVQEGASNSNTVLDPVTLTVVRRVPTGKGPVNVSFSPDGRLGYITHTNDTVVSVIDTKTLSEVQRIVVGTNPQVLAVHPNGKSLYAILTKEAAVAVIDTSSWTVSARIPLGTNPTGIFLRAIS